MFWFYFRYSHTSHTTSVLNQRIRDLTGYIFYQAISRWPCECSDFDTMFLSQLNLFPVQNLPFIIHYHLFHCEGCALGHFSNFSIEVPEYYFHVVIGNCITFLFQRTIKFFFAYFILFFSWGMCWYQCQIVTFHRNSNFTNSFIYRFKLW